MASGTISGSGSYVTLKISWSSTAGSGGSTVTATLYAVNDTYDYYYATVNNGYSLTVNGTTVSGSTAKLSATEGGTATLISSSVWVPYTGSKSITLSGTADMSNIYRNGSTSLGTRSVSGTATLDTIGSKPSASVISAPTTSVISETATSITISWGKNTDSTATYTLQVSKNGGSYTNVKTSIANATVSYAYAITAGQGNTYRFRLCAVNNMGSSSYSYSGTVTTNKLTAPAIGTLSTYNPYVTATLSVPLSGGSQTDGGAFTRRAALYYGSTLLANCTAPSNGNTTVSITYAAANFASKLGTTKYSDTFKIVAWTQNSNGSKSSTVSKNFTVNLNSDGGAVPTLAAPTLSGGFTGYTTTCFIAGISSLKVTSGSASANRAPSGTTLTYSISCTGFSAVASSSATFSKPTAGRKTITVTVTDSRGLSTSKTVYCRFQSWAKPTVKITKAERNSTTPTTINVTYTVSYSPIYNTYGADANTAGTQINGISAQQYTTSSTYTACTSPITITGISAENSCTVTVRASDKIATTTYGTASKSVGTTVVYTAMRSHGIGLNCVPSSGYRLDVNGAVRFGNSTYNTTISNGYLTTNTYTGTYIKGNTGRALINSDAPAGNYVALYKGNSTNGNFTLGNTGVNFILNYTDGDTVAEGANSVTYRTVLMDEDGNATFGRFVTSNSGFYAGSSVYGKDHVELSGANPYIDFHYDNSTESYTSRLYESASGTLRVTGAFVVNGNLSTFGRLTATDGVSASNWIRTNGNYGWYSQEHGGGIYMNDDTTVRIYNNKKFYTGSEASDAIKTPGGIQGKTLAFTNDTTSYITARTGGGFDFWFTDQGLRIVFEGGKIYKCTADGMWTILAE